MRHLRVILPFTLLLFSLACLKDNPLGIDQGFSQIHVTIGLPEVEPVSSPDTALDKAVAFYTIILTVTADDMETIEEELDISSDGKTASGTVQVPKGEERTFTIVIKDQDDITRFEGSNTVDVLKGSKTVTIVAHGLYSEVTVHVNILAKEIYPPDSGISLGKSLVTTTVILTVSAADMPTIEESLTDIDPDGNSATGTVVVRKGNDRTFTIECKDANGVVQYSGSATQDVLAATATVSITTEGHYPSASTLSITSFDAVSVTLSWAESTESDFASYELVRAGTAEDIESSSTRESIFTITGKTTTTYTDDSVSPNTRYYYAIIVWDTEGMGMRSSPPVSVQTPQYFSAPGPWAIPDDGYKSLWFLNNSFAPSGSMVTNVEYRLRIGDAGDPFYFFCADYEIYISSSPSPGALEDNLVYDNLGGWTDGDFDDDVEDDTDIYLDWRTTDHFNGETPNQYWGVYIIDNWSGDYGQLDYLEFRIHYDAPSSSPGLITIKVPASAADEGPSLNRSHPSGAAQGSIDPVSTGFDKIKSPAGQ